ncbi:MAG: hypothetical protein MK160_05535 [Rhodobacteraceae bacterium]|nr:hypothetical protein [Paracoccaceae bacterium]
MTISHDDVAAYFTRPDGAYHFARWGRPLAPIVFGVQDETLQTLKGAFEVVCALAGHKMAETDPELGSNVMVFFFREWEELTDVPDLDRLIPDLAALVVRLKAGNASQYRAFRFDKAGAFQACFVFLRMAGPLASVPAEDLMLSQVVQLMLLWSENAFAQTSPLAKLDGGKVILRPEIGAILRAAYDPVMPGASQDASHALRLAARLARGTDA